MRFRGYDQDEGHTPPPLRGRIAPTPSGLLHLGNAVNFVLTWLLVRRTGGVLRLRIDDADCARSRMEYVEDIFRQLEWLKIDWDEGPRGPDEFRRHFSQRLRIGRYRSLMQQLLHQGDVFPCTCSRRQLRDQAGDRPYPGTCRRRRDTPPEPHAWRALVASPCPIQVGTVTVPLDQVMGDFVLWRRDDLPSYQLASLADDIDDGIDLVVRGEDLLSSTAAQIFLAGRLHAQGFLAARFVHHPLLTSADGTKLSKSAGALSLAAVRAAGCEATAVYREAAAMLGLPRDCACSLEALLAAVAVDTPEDFTPSLGVSTEVAHG